MRSTRRAFHPHRGGGSERSRGGRGGGRPPQGLRGRELGMWYAQRQQNRNAEQERPVLTLSARDRDRLNEDISGLSKFRPFNTSASGQEFVSCYRKNLDGNEKRENDQAPDSWENLEQQDRVESLNYGSELLDQFNIRQQSEKYQRLLAFRKKLPAFKMRQKLVDKIKDSAVTVISGETGCGKTTQVPQFILDHALESGEGDQCRIICTQPRRISAITIAERVSDERGEAEVGGDSSVGYQIRLETRAPRPRASITFCTTGVVLQWMRGDPMLKNVSHIILDEIHERDILSDFLITILKDLLPKRPSLKVILMSATLNAEQFSKYFSNCPMINIPGYTFPVKEYYLEDVLEMTGFQIQNHQPMSENRPIWHKYTAKGKEQRGKDSDYEDFIAPYLRDIASSGTYSRQTIESLSSPRAEDLNHELVASLVHHIHTRQPEGAILVFLPGWEDISKLSRLLSEGRYAIGARAKVYPLHSLMPTATQKEIFQRPPSGMRKIVIATNIAETSITIDDVVYVVDCGKIKMTNFDVDANISTLQPEWVSLANARQRRGRAGRVQAGICYHLYTRPREMTLSQFVVPEMLRTRLEEVILQIKILELGRASSFLSRVMEPPSDRCLELSVDSLVSLGALDCGEQLTPLGFHLAQLPMDPHTGKMILLGGVFCCLDPVLSVAASLSFKDAFFVPLGKERDVEARKRVLAAGTRSDHFMLANAISEWEVATRRNQSRDYCWNNYLSESTLRMLSNMKDQFAEHLRRLRFVATANCKASEANVNSGNEDLVRAIICAGLYPNVAKLRVRRNKHRGAFPVLQTLQERRVSVHPKSVIANEGDFKHPFVAFHQKLKSTSVYVHDCSEMSPIALIFFGREIRVGEEVTPDQRLIETIAVDRFITLHCSRATGEMFIALRKHLDQLLEHKISNPGATDWAKNRREGAILSSVIQLLSCSFDGSRVEDDDAYDEA